MIHLLIVCLVSTAIHCAVNTTFAFFITITSKRRYRIVHGFGPTIVERRIRTAHLCVKMIPLSNSVGVDETIPSSVESGAEVPERAELTTHDWLLLGVCPFANFVLSMCAANYSESYDVSIFVCFGLYLVVSNLTQFLCLLYQSHSRHDLTEEQAIPLFSLKGLQILLYYACIWAIFVIWLIGSINHAEWIQTTANVLRFKTE